MGTNYYLEPKPACEKCGRDFERLHIGKSSAGWVFALHVYPDDGINDLPDWWDRWNAPGTVIRDEYGKKVSAPEMLAVVLARFGRRDKDSEGDGWLMQNQATRGPFGLARSRVDGHRVLAHGEGTYDLHAGDFS